VEYGELPSRLPIRETLTARITLLAQCALLCCASAALLSLLLRSKHCRLLRRLLRRALSFLVAPLQVLPTRPSFVGTLLQSLVVHRRCTCWRREHLGGARQVRRRGLWRSRLR
jgi:hypothetical protein